MSILYQLSSKRSFCLITIVCFSCIISVILKVFILFEVTYFILLCADWSKYVLSHTDTIRSSKLITYPCRQKKICFTQELECTILINIHNDKYISVMPVKIHSCFMLIFYSLLFALYISVFLINF